MKKKAIIFAIAFLISEIGLAFCNSVVHREAVTDFLKLLFLSVVFYLILNLIIFFRYNSSKDIHIQVLLIVCSSIGIIGLIVMSFEDLFYLIPMMLILPILFTGLLREYGIMKKREGTK